MHDRPEQNTPESEVKDGISYPKLPPRDFDSVDAESYIAERFNDAISWYDTKAVWAKALDPCRLAGLQRSHSPATPSTG